MERGRGLLTGLVAALTSLVLWLLLMASVAWLMPRLGVLLTALVCWAAATLARVTLGLMVHHRSWC